MANDEPELTRNFTGHKSEVTSVEFDVENRFLVSSSSDSTLMLWKLNQTGALRFLGHKDGVNDASCSPSSKLIASCSRDRTIRCWNPKGLNVWGSIKAHTSTVRSVKFSPDSSKLVSASDDKLVKTWSVLKREFIASYVGHTNWVRCANYSPSGRTIVSCSDDKTVRLWDTASSKQISQFNEITGYGMCVSFHPNGFNIGVGLSNGVIKIYDVRAQKLLQHYADHIDSISKFSFHPTGKYLLTSSRDGTLKVLDVLEGRAIYTIEAHKGAVSCCVFSTNGDQFASGGVDQQVFVWKTNFDKRDFVYNTESVRSQRGTYTEDSCDKRLSFTHTQANSENDLPVFNVDCSNVRVDDVIKNVQQDVHVDKHEPCCKMQGFVDNTRSEPLSMPSVLPETADSTAHPETMTRLPEDITLNHIYKAVTILDARVEKAENNLRDSIEQLCRRVERLENDVDCLKRQSAISARQEEIIIKNLDKDSSC